MTSVSIEPQTGCLRIALTGATGTIGSATRTALEQAGHLVTCLTRTDLIDPKQLARLLQSAKVEAVISCMASRTGTRQDAWEVDHDAQQRLLLAAKEAGVEHFVLLSAICVQRPRLAFQEAKLAFERALMGSGIDWTIVRPTAFFKSLSGQLRRVSQGKSFLVFGSGQLTACKPISDRDLARFLVRTLTDPRARHAILPIGGPGPALSPLDQAEMLSRILGRRVRVQPVPASMLLTVARLMQLLSSAFPRLEEKAEYARIGHYYATESMLAWNEQAQQYDPEATPSFGEDRLEDHYRQVLSRLAESVSKT
ncbi:MAG: NAD-dependent epimerase/dehydratase family protein [Betaproteobacteria bacterium]|nr:NAD-dependent epimerase/dehydratase family protein [Betaproteobacteria bacterium]